MNDLTLSPDSAVATDASLSHLSLLVVRGPDARTFLDSQLTRNVPTRTDLASLAGYCSPKGRLLASFVVWADDDAISLVVSRDIAAAIAKRLRMYVLRAKVTIEESGLRLAGVVDAPAVADLPAWGVAREHETTWVRWPDVDAGVRALRVSTSSDDGVDAATWRWLDIRAGLPTITAPIQDRFVPQMLNLEALGGVDFKKGCYPGQEVVARSQYLGKLKRRMALATIAGTAIPPAGADVIGDGSADPIGLVVAAERGPDGRIAALIELPVASFAADGLRVVGIDGAAVTIDALPYALPDNEVFVRPKL
jgi:folate-binding protein YgfZ